MKVAIVGAGGRMGRALVRAVDEASGAELSGAYEREGSAHIGQDAGTLAGLQSLGIEITGDIGRALEDTDVIIDFTAPSASVAFARLAADRGIAHIIGTTGCTTEDDAAIAQAARKTRIVKSGNMSLGVNLLASLVEQAARALGPDAFDIEVLEMHHKHKVDAPSGTALLLGEAAAHGRGIDLRDNAVMSREGHTGARQEGTIGFATLRGGSVVGDHSVILAGAGERITISHHAEDRAIFARGAVKAALWVHQHEAHGLYSMRDVLGLQ
ncbi:4-hydroxy-tetrahydrodipicolinate reductase [Limoniibacter endophyticus]